MKFKYTGDQKEMPLRGIVFEKGKAVEVEDEAFAARLRNLDYFTEVKKRKPKNDKNSPTSSN